MVNISNSNVCPVLYKLVSRSVPVKYRFLSSLAPVKNKLFSNFDPVASRSPLTISIFVSSRWPVSLRSLPRLRMLALVIPLRVTKSPLTLSICSCKCSPVSNRSSVRER